MAKNIYTLLGFPVNDDPEIEKYFDYYVIRFKLEGGFYVAGVTMEKTPEMKWGDWSVKKIHRWQPVPGYNNLLMFFQDQNCEGAWISQVDVFDNQITKYLSDAVTVKNYDELVEVFQGICEKINEARNEPN